MDCCQFLTQNSNKFNYDLFVAKYCRFLPHYYAASILSQGCLKAYDVDEGNFKGIADFILRIFI